MTTALTRNAAPRATLWVLAINAIALIAFTCAPVAQEYPLAAVGILAFLLVQAVLPACRIRVTAPVCPANIAQGYYWIQLVLITVLVGYFGFSQGVLPHLPSKDAMNLAIVVHVVGYLSFCVAYQCGSRVTVRRGRSHGGAAGTAYLIVPFAVVGVLGFLLEPRGPGGIQRLRRVAGRGPPAGRGGRDAGRGRRQLPEALPRLRGGAGLELVARGVAAPEGVDHRHDGGGRGAPPIANFNYNRGSMLGPIVGLAAAFSMHVRRIPFKGVVLAGVLALSVAFVFGWYRSTDLDISELSASAMADSWNPEEVVEFLQIYAGAPQMSAYLIESLEGKFYYGATLVPSLVYPIPVLGKPYRDVSGPVIFNGVIYGDTGVVDQIIPLDGELYINFHLAGVVLGHALLGWGLAWLQGRFMAAASPVESYAWLMIALWTVFPGSLSVSSQIYVYSFWPIYVYFAVKSVRAWSAATAGFHGDRAAVKYS